MFEDRDQVFSSMRPSGVTLEWGDSLKAMARHGILREDLRMRVAKANLLHREQNG